MQEYEFVCGVRAKDNCEAVSPNDLSFVIGELMDIVKNPTDQPKWIARKVGEIILLSMGCGINKTY